MMFKNLALSLCLLIIVSTSLAQEKKYKVHTLAFYNIENLFDAEDDPITFDEDFTPEGSYAWTEEKYTGKLERM
ncbi:MAG: endonuclease/exonuclease/phosphatase family protein, partial [Flavobacteriaceae bacterium]|nr:endonuclease/exonuclease/phosphatase family protein [Flavobacteriaceae bacterium]